MKNVLLVTSSFPYGYKEQFLEHEIPCWNVPGVKITVCPLSKSSDRRGCSPAILDDSLSIFEGSPKFKFNDIPLLSLDRIFWKEVRSDISIVFDFRRLKSLITWTVLSNRLKRKIIENVERLDSVNIIYCYWSHWMLKAFSEAKEELGMNWKLISRAHRSDLYRYAMPGNYMPFSFSFDSAVDCIYSVSEDGKAYLQKEYSIPENKVRVSRLGVPDSGDRHTSISGPKPDHIEIVSVSYAKPVKRIDRIIDAIACLKKTQDLDVKWSHIGDGPVLEELKDYAKANEVECEWLGMRDNSFVQSFLRSKSHAIFVNSSESEGVPVSIMEAFSHGLRVVATDVGGTREIVNNHVGRLVPQYLSNAELSEAILDAHTKLDFGGAIMQHFERRCGLKNFDEFITQLYEEA